MNLLKVFVGLSFLLAFSNVQAQKDTLKTNVVIVDWTPPVKYEETYLSEEDKTALNQFIAFCKIQIDIENPNYHYSTGYTYFIINALEINSSTISKDSLKSQLNIVRENDSIKYKFLTSISKVSNNDYDNVYNFVRPPSIDNRYISKISKKDAETLTNLILSKYYYYEPQSNDTTAQKITPLTKIDRVAEFKGGKQRLNKYIYSKIEFPKIKNLDNRIDEVEVIATIQVNTDGSLSDYNFNTSIKGNLTELEKENLSNDISYQYENIVAKIISNMPNWIPAQSTNKNVNSKVSFPIIFKYQ
ncbi:hypothetical protein [Kordia zhangzhouensis]|uniref:hypothetical protein n=1 Tax=Kordia zhangzhouensis TaxID=1620405 RepID=UPI0006296E63|nr:hypothetical protein [Kordia zhangzhouensis]